MAKILINTDKLTYFENDYLAYDKLNMDCKMILRSLIAIRKLCGNNPVVSVSFFSKRFGMSERRVGHSIKILENRKFLTPYLKKTDKKIYEFALDEHKITETFNYFKF